MSYTYRVKIGNSFDLLVVICSSQLRQAFRVKFATVREELCTVLLGQFCAEGVDGNDKGSPVSFKLWQREHECEHAMTP